MPDNNNEDFYLEEEGKVNSETENSVKKNTDISAELKPQPANVVKLFRGEEFSLKELTEVTYRYTVKKIYILGEHDSGKTTILATLFEMFQFATFNGLSYSGSLTQIGFEKRCFHARLASENTNADTERTKTEEFRFLHIALKSNPKANQADHFLISDISGEKIEQARSKTKDMKDLEVISDATHVSYIIDGGKLINPLIRQTSLTQAKTFIRKALDEKIFTNQTRLSIIVSKWDVLETNAEFDYDSLIVNQFKRDFNSKLYSLTFLKIAVRPKSFLQFKLGHGLSDLLDVWSSPKKQQVTSTLPKESSRMIDKLIF